MIVVAIVAAGAIVLAGLNVGRVIETAARADRSARANEALAARSAALVLAPVAIRPSVSPDGATVLSVHLTARVYAAQAIALPTDGSAPSDTNPVFRLTAPHAMGVVGTYAPPAAELMANRVTDFILTFDFRDLSSLPEAGREVASVGLGPPTPGIWLLEMDLVDAAGLTYRASTPVMVIVGA